MGLRDHTNEIQLITHLIITKLSPLYPQIVGDLAFQNALVEPLRPQLFQKIKENAVKQEVERYHEVAKSIIRCLMAVNNPTGNTGSLSDNSGPVATLLTECQSANQSVVCLLLKQVLQE